MSTNYNQFMVSVADVIIRDTVADQIMIYGKTEIDSSIKQAVSTTEITGGFGQQLLYTFQHGKKLNFTINDARFDEGYLALNSGALIANTTQNVWKREIITLNGSGVGTLSATPVANVYLKGASGVVATVVPSTTTVTYVSFANQQVEAVYKYSNTVDTIDLNAALFAKPYELTLIGKLFDKNGQYGEVQIIIPQFKPDGNFDLAFKQDGALTSPLAGQALADQVTSSYGSFNIVYTSSTVNYIAIAGTPNPVNLSTTTTTQQLTVYGIRGGAYSNVTLAPSSCTYTSGTPATATVGASTGLITRVAVGTSIITIQHTASGLKDYITVNVT
jgi:hypothetical protein